MKDFQIDWRAEAVPFLHTWEGLVNIDQFRWLVRGDVQAQLRMAHKELGARCVRAVGMFDDELRAMGIDPRRFAEPQNTACRPNYQILDYITDTLVEMGIWPMITTTFVPGCMAAGEHTVFTTKGRTDLPRDFAEWEAFIQAYTEHVTGRYGKKNVAEWYFEVWNEPNLFPFFAGTQADYFRLWEHTRRAVKAVCPDYRVGGPSTARGEWVEAFLNWTRERDCQPDFLAVHIYNRDSEDESLSPFGGAQAAKINRRADFAAEVIRGVRGLADRMHFRGEIHWNEWGRSWWICDPDRESANEAGYSVKTMSEVSQCADCCAYWCLSDVYDQGGYGAEAFHGNYGMLSLNSLRKPSYHAFSLLSMCGEERIPAAVLDGGCTGCIATRSQKEYVFLYYCFRPEEDGGLPHTVRFNLPEDARRGDMELYLVDRTHNNAPARWRRMGSPQYPTPEEVAGLRAEDCLAPAENGPGIEGEYAVFRLDGAGAALVKVPRVSSVLR